MTVTQIALKLYRWDSIAPKQWKSESDASKSNGVGGMDTPGMRSICFANLAVDRWPIGAEWNETSRETSASEPLKHGS